MGGWETGGSAWESNPAPPRQRGATDFEDREGHRAPFASQEATRAGSGWQAQAHDRHGIAHTPGRVPVCEATEAACLGAASWG